MSAILVLGLFIWFTVALLPAYLAKQKGYSFLLFLLASWVVSWVLTLVVVLVLKDKTNPEPEHEAAS